MNIISLILFVVTTLYIVYRAICQFSHRSQLDKASDSYSSDNEDNSLAGYSSKIKVKQYAKY